MELTAPNTELARDLAMHVVATAPMVVRPEDLPQEVLDKEREIYCRRPKKAANRQISCKKWSRVDQKICCRG